MTTAARAYVRFSLARRIEHVAMLLSFTTLGLTGLPQKYADAGISLLFVSILGGVEAVRIVHHVAAVVMMLGTAWHLLVMGYHVFVLRSRMSMLPTLQDAKDGLRALKYNVGLAKSYPQMGRYTFEEKMEYWAFVWGAIIMGATGFLMWNPITVTRFLPGELVPAAKAAHGAEAVLAVLAIIIWHMYGVHLKRLNKAMWTGKQSEAEMLHEHPLELADLKAGIADRAPSPAMIRGRKRVYYPVAALLTVIMLGAVYGFVNSEQTALTTLPPHERVQIFVPQTATPTATMAPTQPVPPSATPAAPVLASTWDGSVGALLQQKCTSCHAAAGMAGLDLASYAEALTGGGSGPAIVPGDSTGSLLVVRQQAGAHPGQLTPEEIALLIAWIDAGAPER
jgi:cytochrome b subunit of formate dehydrogenase/mono/diheme cytochrome c family protein